MKQELYKHSLKAIHDSFDGFDHEEMIIVEDALLRAEKELMIREFVNDLDTATYIAAVIQQAVLQIIDGVCKLRRRRNADADKISALAQGAIDAQRMQFEDAIIKDMLSNITPAIKGEITKGKLKWRGITFMQSGVGVDTTYWIEQRGKRITSKYKFTYDMNVQTGNVSSHLVKF